MTLNQYEKALKSIKKLGLIDTKRFPYVIDNLVGIMAFFNGKFPVTPETLVDLQYYYGISPDIYLEYISLYVDQVEAPNVIDFRQSYRDYQKGVELLTHQFIIHEYDTIKNTRGKELGVHYLVAPVPNAGRMPR